ncbi:MAG: hypothetical protein QM490_01835 [Candidatus Gracilibacteria bacterium]
MSNNKLEELERLKKQNEEKRLKSNNNTNSYNKKKYEKEEDLDFKAMYKESREEVDELINNLENNKFYIMFWKSRIRRFLTILLIFFLFLTYLISNKIINDNQAREQAKQEFNKNYNSSNTDNW